MVKDRDHWRTTAEAERGRVDRLLAVLAERRPERRPWPGLRAWWRRVWEGKGGYELTLKGAIISCPQPAERPSGATGA